MLPVQRVSVVPDAGQPGSLPPRAVAELLPPAATAPTLTLTVNVALPLIDVDEPTLRIQEIRDALRVQG